MIKKYLNRYKRKKFRETQLPEMTQQEKLNAEQLRTQVSSLDPIPPSHLKSTETWNQNRRQLRELIQNDDPRKFLTWEVIMHTMFCEPKPLELEAVKKKAYFNNASPAVVGRAYPFSGTNLDGNTVHQLYNLSFLLDRIKDFSKIDHIIEFGGGYGNTCRLAYDLEFQGDYVIFDLPEFSYLQEYFLKSHKQPLTEKAKTIPVDEKVHLVDSIESLEKSVTSFNWERTLFIATWSLSECNLDLRKAFMNIINPKNFLIAFQSQFGEVDNVEYFKEFQNARNDISWELSPIEHLKSSFYLSGVYQK